jgi:hypothetical protein
MTAKYVVSGQPAQEVAVQHALERVDSERTRTGASPREYWRNVHGDRLLESVKAAWAQRRPRAFQDHLIKAGVEPACVGWPTGRRA